jgi:NMD protein affecting ribosome stability and mRNA decay
MPHGPSNRTGVEEKGGRTIRNTESYMPRGLKEGSTCRGCGIVYHNKRWQSDGMEVEKSCDVLCPACQRMQDHNPAGVVTLSGPYLASHKNEILNTIKQEESKHRAKNPLGRIMEITDEQGLLTVTTTEDKLAQKLGREVFKSQKGELHYQWSHDQRVVRVDWTRH